MYTSDLRSGKNGSIVNELVEIDPGANLYLFSSEASDEEQKFCLLNLGGAGGIRTPYLLTASQTFSRLNYSPTTK